MNMIDELKISRRLRVTARLVFDTAWRIGTGKEGITSSDLGVLLDPAGLAILPGSSLKGKLRSTCEGLAHALDRSACFLNVTASGVKCVSDIQYYKLVKDEHSKSVRTGDPNKLLTWINENTCDICKLFGSPARASRLRCADGILEVQDAAVVQVRDGVVIDRDSHTAVPKLKYDYEVLPASTCFSIRFDLENASDVDEALFGVALFEWSAGGSIGGFTSRGLGQFHLEEIKVAGVNLEDGKERVAYLTAIDPSKRLRDRGDWKVYFTNKIESSNRGK